MCPEVALEEPFHSLFTLFTSGRAFEVEGPSIFSFHKGLKNKKRVSWDLGAL